MRTDDDDDDDDENKMGGFVISQLVTLKKIFKLPGNESPLN